MIKKIKSLLKALFKKDDDLAYKLKVPNATFYIVQEYFKDKTYFEAMGIIKCINYLIKNKSEDEQILIIKSFVNDSIATIRSEERKKIIDNILAEL